MSRTPGSDHAVRRIGLGCMRLSTVAPRDDERAIEVILAALDAGVTLLDTADVYCSDESDIGHNERFIARALHVWRARRVPSNTVRADATARIEIATKGGLTRPHGRWLPDARAVHLRAACEASLRALEVDAIDLYQLHAVDPRVPFETSVRALAGLQRDGLIRHVGLCNVNVSQIEAARDIVPIAAVQISLSVFDQTNLRNGVAEYCRDHDIRLIAYRPLGGERAARLARDPALQAIAARHGATAQEIALAWLLDLDPNIIPIPGATRVLTATSSGRALSLQLSAEDRAHLDAQFTAGRQLRVPRAQRQPPASTTGRVVVVMGMPGAGKSTVAQEYAARGYARLNRDETGGRLADLVQELNAGLAAGQPYWVLDNTYASRAARNEVIECAWQHGVPVQCVHLTTSVADAQINAVSRLIAAHGRLPTPDELRALGRTDHRYFGPDAQFRYERQLEPPVVDEGFTDIELRSFVRQPTAAFTRRAIILEFDGVLCTSASGAATIVSADDVMIPPMHRATLARHAADGWVLCALAWRPETAGDIAAAANIDALFNRVRQLLELDVDIAFCPHPAGPPICWCRKPLPGLVLEFAHRHQLALDRSIMVGRAPADRTLAQRLGMTYREASNLFAGN